MRDHVAPHVRADVRGSVDDLRDVTGWSTPRVAAYWGYICLTIIADAVHQRTVLTPETLIQITNYVVRYRALEIRRGQR